MTFDVLSSRNKQKAVGRWWKPRFRWCFGRNFGHIASDWTYQSEARIRMQYWCKLSKEEVLGTWVNFQKVRNLKCCDAFWAVAPQHMVLFWRKERKSIMNLWISNAIGQEKYYMIAGNSFAKKNQFQTDQLKSLKMENFKCKVTSEMALIAVLNNQLMEESSNTWLDQNTGQYFFIHIHWLTHHPPFTATHKIVGTNKIPKNINCVRQKQMNPTMTTPMHLITHFKVNTQPVLGHNASAPHPQRTFFLTMPQMYLWICTCNKKTKKNNTNQSNSIFQVIQHHSPHNWMCVCLKIVWFYC